MPHFLKMIPVLALLGALNVAALGALYGWDAVFLPAESATEETLLEIEPGWSARRIGGELARAGLVEHAMHFEWAVRWSGEGERLRAGRFALPPGLSPLELADELTRGGRLELEKLTIPEGTPTREIARRAYAACGIEPARFEAALRAPELLARHGINAVSAEGYLFPDTYDVAGYGPGDATRLVERMLSRFDEVAGEIGLASTETLSRQQVVILGSIIEREAWAESEHAEIAAVFQNRLRKRMPLGSCATVHYALGRWSGPLRLSDLDVPSPYNTYRHAGLPPGPICSPGRRSLLAAMHPADSDALYFVARGDGTHYFSRTFREHRAARREAAR